MEERPEERPPSPTVRLGNLLFHLRSFTPVPILALLAWRLAVTRSQPGPGGERLDLVLNAAGWLVALAGQALRFYTLGQVPEGTSGQGNQLQAVTLNTRGPYAHVRNPLYVGNLGICLGLMLIAHDPVCYLVGLGFFFGEYFFIIRAEENFLRERFGAAFEDFVAKVPRWVPRWTAAYPGELRMGFDVKRALKKEHNPFAAWASGAILLMAWEAWARGLWSPTLAWTLGLSEALVLASFVLIKSYKRGYWGQPRSPPE